MQIHSTELYLFIQPSMEIKVMVDMTKTFHSIIAFRAQYSIHVWMQSFAPPTRFCGNKNGEVSRSIDCFAMSQRTNIDCNTWNINSIKKINDKNTLKWEYWYRLMHFIEIIFKFCIPSTRMKYCGWRIGHPSSRFNYITYHPLAVPTRIAII